MQTFYMVLNEDTHYTSYRHNTYEDAEKEAIRLVNLHPNTKFIILCAYSCVEKNDIKITQYSDIPF